MPRHSASQPVFIQPDSSPDLYTFNNSWHRTFCSSFIPCPGSKLNDRVGEHPLTCCVNPCSLMVLRTKVRTAFHIRGSLIEDCYTTNCCACVCAAMQIENELDHQGIPNKCNQ